MKAALVDEGPWLIVDHLLLDGEGPLVIEGPSDGLVMFCSIRDL